MAESIINNDNNIRVTTTPISPAPIERILKVSDKRLIEDINGDKIYVKISSFNEDGKIRITGDYSQNYVDFPKYDLSPLKVLDDISFKFILGIKETETSPKTIYYTSKTFYENELLSSYQNNEPYLVNNTIKQEKIVIVYLEKYKKKLEDLRNSELSLPIQEIFSGGILMEKNLFMNSNYSTDSTQQYGVKATPTYNMRELVKYVDWVVSKPSNDYDNRLLDEREIGKWNEVDTQPQETTNITTSPNEPPLETTNNTNTPSYPPVGRIGDFTGEIVQLSNGDEYQWIGSSWVSYDRGNDYDGFGGGRF